jgi:hypothetical protein
VSDSLRNDDFLASYDVRYDPNFGLNSDIAACRRRAIKRHCISFEGALNYLFDTAGIDKVKASVLERNQVTLKYLLKLGWQIDPIPAHKVKSSLDGAMLEVLSLSFTREAFCSWKQSNVGQRILARINSAESARAAQATATNVKAAASD